MLATCLAVLLPVAAAPPASAANCAQSTVHWFPGLSALPHYRLGEATANFSGCGGTPSGWSFAANPPVTNGTGHALQYSINYSRVELGGIGSYYRFFYLRIGLYFDPKGPPPGKQEAEWLIEYYAYYDSGSLHFMEIQVRQTKGNATSGYALYRTA